MVDPSQPVTGREISASQDDGFELLRVIAVGSKRVVQGHIHRMYQLGYAQPHEWSSPFLPTVNEGEVMSILTKRVLYPGRNG